MAPEWNGEDWTCAVDAPAWRSLYSRLGTGLEVFFLPLDDVAEAPPSSRQLAELVRFLRQQANIRLIVESEIRSYYSRIRPRYVDFLEDPDNDMPEQLDVENFERIHALQRLYVHREDTASVVCIGLSFHALWEIEHGLGVLLNADAIVSIGGADAAFLKP